MADPYKRLDEIMADAQRKQEEATTNAAAEREAAAAAKVDEDESRRKFDEKLAGVILPTLAKVVQKLRDGGHKAEVNEDKVYGQPRVAFCVTKGNHDRKGALTLTWVPHLLSVLVVDDTQKTEPGNSASKNYTVDQLTEEAISTLAVDCTERAFQEW